MSSKMDDVLNIDIDPALLLSYELDRLNLDNIANDIFEFSEEIPKNSDNADDENSLLSEIKKNKLPAFKEKYALKFSIAEDKCATECQLEEHPNNEKQENDINRNECSSYESLNKLFDNLELSDSDNETNEDTLKLTERGGPIKTPSRAKKNRDQSDILLKNKGNDKSQFNPQTLKFLSGSSQIKINEPNISGQFNIHPSQISLHSGSETVPTFPSQDYFYGDARAKAVSSPESGYESSSALSGSSSPPLFPLSTSYNLDFIPETVDEQNILEFLAENTTDCALIERNLSACESDDKDAEDKIVEIINYLKGVPEELSESSSNAIAPFDSTIHENVPLVSNIQDLNFKPLSVSPNIVSKNAETPKKLVYKLDDKAKRTLREFLSDDEFYAAKARIYRKINEDMANSKVIYVEDESDKASENRTNLHYAVLNSKIEEIYCLVEIHKQYNMPFTDINIRDKYGKTALDYAIQNKMTLVVDYLKENTACQSVSV